MDQFISENKLKWVPYNKFKDIKYLDKGGFGTIYKATYKKYKVILKYFDYLSNSDESLNEFLNEWKIIDSSEIIRIYGFTKDPDTSNYMVIMEYANRGNLRGCLIEIANNWQQKLYKLNKIIIGLNTIHKKGLIHYNFHDGNILYSKYDKNYDGIYISDYLESCQLAKSFLKKDNIYGIIPFMAPEVLRGEPYTQASNIYSFSIIMWEFTSGILPFNDKAHDLQLALSICKGERPKIIENTPQCYVDLMKKCWDEDPSKRPSASDILDTIKNWIFHSKDINEELKSNIMEFINTPIEHNNQIVESHPQACYTSHLLNFTSGELNKSLEGFQESFESKQKYQSSQNELQNIQQNLTLQNEEFAKKESTSQIQITNLQSEKQALDGKLTEQLKQISQNLTLQNEEFAKKESTLQIQITNLQSEKQALDGKLTEQLKQISQNLTLQNEEFAKKEGTLQIQITNLQSEKQALDGKLTEQLKQISQNLTLQNEEFAKKEGTLQIQITNLQSEKLALDGKLTEQLKQISQLNQEKNNLQDKLVQKETITQELKSQQDQFKNQLNQFQIDYKQIEEENLKLENELVDLQQRNFKFEQNNQNLRLNLAEQIKEFARTENILQTQIIDLQNEKQNLASNLTEQLKQNKLTNQQVQDQICQLKQEEIKLQEKLAQTETNIQELKSHKESLIEQKEQLENRLRQFQVNYEQIEQEKIRLQNMMNDLLQDQKPTTELKAKLEKEIAQLEQKLIIEEQIKMQLTQALQIKEDKVNELEMKLVTLDQERIKQLKNKEKELSKVKGELIDKLTSGENTKEIHKEKEAKQREIDELQQELSRTSVSYDVNRKKQVFNQVNNFLKAKDDFLTLREEAIKKLRNCLENFNKKGNTIGTTRDMKTSNLADKYTKEFQNILAKYNDGLLELNKNYYSLKNIVQENKELEVSLMIENIFKLNSFNLDKYKIFKFATNSQEGTRIQLDSNMMAEDINSLKKNLNELKLELEQEKKELRNLAATILMDFMNVDSLK
ncbi:unnamed protein product [Rhizophagus irregularis]|nr:unnamed protein product [Rhizophagus irregularis]